MSGSLLRFRIVGASMEPTFRDGDGVLVDPGAYGDASPAPGDVVLARHPFKRGTRIVKRVGGVTPEGRLVLVGDNPSASTDSRGFGTLAPDRVVGRVLERIDLDESVREAAVDG